MNINKYTKLLTILGTMSLGIGCDRDKKALTAQEDNITVDVDGDNGTQVAGQDDTSPDGGNDTDTGLDENAESESNNEDDFQTTQPIETGAEATGLSVAKVLSPLPDRCEPLDEINATTAFDIAVDTALSDLPWHYEVKHGGWDLSDVTVTASVIPKILQNPPGVVGLIVNTSIDVPVTINHDTDNNLLRLSFDEADVVFESTGNARLQFKIQHDEDTPIEWQESFVVNARDRYTSVRENPEEDTTSSIAEDVQCLAFIGGLDTRATSTIPTVNIAVKATVNDRDGNTIDISISRGEEGQRCNGSVELNVGRYRYKYSGDADNYVKSRIDRTADDPFLAELADHFNLLAVQMLGCQTFDQFVLPNSVNRFLSQNKTTTQTYPLYKQEWNDRCHHYATSESFQINETITKFHKAEFQYLEDTEFEDACINPTFSE